MFTLLHINDEAFDLITPAEQNELRCRPSYDICKNKTESASVNICIDGGIRGFGGRLRGVAEEFVERWGSSVSNRGGCILCFTILGGIVIVRLICWTETVANERGAHPFMPSFCLVSEIDSFSHLLIKEDIVTTHCTQDFGRKGEGAEIIRTMKRERWEDLKTRRGFLLSNSIKDETKRETTKRARKIQMKMLITGGVVVTDYKDKKRAVWKSIGEKENKRERCGLESPHKWWTQVRTNYKRRLKRDRSQSTNFCLI